MGTENSGWLIESSRLTLFVSPEQPLTEMQAWFEAAVGRAPEHQFVNSATGQKQFVAQLASGKCVLSAVPGRIDWQYLPRDQRWVAARAFPHVSESFEEIDSFYCRVNEVLRRGDIACSRVALGLIAFRPVADDGQAKEFLSRYVRHARVPDQPDDFMYRVNMRLPAASAQPLVNRVACWSVAQLVTFDLPAAGQPAGAPTQQLSARACRLELDINTDATAALKISGNALLSLTESLQEHVGKVLLQGERPCSIP